jgi:hypothetical protein
MEDMQLSCAVMLCWQRSVTSCWSTEDSLGKSRNGFEVAPGSCDLAPAGVRLSRRNGLGIIYEGESFLTGGCSFTVS